MDISTCDTPRCTRDDDRRRHAAETGAWRSMMVGFAGWLADTAMRMIDHLLEWQDRARQRLHLQSLDDRMLSDMGLSRADVEHEVRKPFWQI